jgi:hypothetical protein
MRRFRITGLVGFAKQVRQELAGPVSPARLGQLRSDIEDCLRTIDGILQDNGVRVRDLPAPSRKAYQFLKGLDLDSVVTEETSAPSGFPPESISFRGLQGHFDGLLNNLARQEDHALVEETYDLIRSASESIEEEIQAQHLGPEQIRKSTRQMRGWLAYFAQRENFDGYGAAVRRAEPVFRAASLWPAGQSVPVLVHFRPLHGMYHIRAYSDAVLVHLPTPMIGFDESLLRSVAQVAFKKGGDRKLLHDAAAGAPYRRIASALELLGGVVAETRGLHHDLAASFARVNTAYFHGAVARPHLVWSRSFATRKFGHYDHAHDTVMVNAVLDRKTVPELAIDFIVYHELLHKQLGILWKSNRLAAHTPEFSEQEHKFQQYDEAKAVLRKLACER